MAPRALRWHLYGFASLAKGEYQHTFHIMVPVVFDDRVLWTKALVPTNALQCNAIKRFCSLARKVSLIRTQWQ